MDELAGNHDLKFTAEIWTNYKSPPPVKNQYKVKTISAKKPSWTLIRVGPLIWAYNLESTEKGTVIKVSCKVDLPHTRHSLIHPVESPELPHKINL